MAQKHLLTDTRVNALVLAGLILLPIAAVLLLSAWLPDLATWHFRVISAALAGAHVFAAGTVTERAFDHFSAQSAWLQRLHPKRRDTLRDIAVLAAPASIVIAVPGGSFGATLFEMGVLALTVALALALYNELEMRRAVRKRR